MSKKRSWEPFSVGTPSTHIGWDEPDCCPLDQVFHIAHVNDAIRIIEDGRIRSGLIYDESCLNTKRTCVSWVSPNLWRDGSIYGNVQFSFDWKALVKDKAIYWVEERKTAKQQIIRLLACNKPFKDEVLEQFDPEKGDGPLFFNESEDKWYFNGKLTNEYMILDDLSLDDCKAISLCSHHASICKRKPEACDELGRTDFDAGAELLAGIVGACSNRWACKFESESVAGQIESSVRNSLKALFTGIAEARKPAKGVALTELQAKALAASMCLAFWHGRIKRLRELGSIFPSKKIIKETLWECAADFFKGLKVIDE